MNEQLMKRVAAMEKLFIGHFPHATRPDSKTIQLIRDLVAATPTQWAYDQACKALMTHRNANEKLREMIRNSDGYRAGLEQGAAALRSVGHPKEAAELFKNDT